VSIPRNILSGSWALTLPPSPYVNPGTTPLLPWNAAPADVVAALATLWPTGSPLPATVTRTTSPSPVGGFTWTITWAGVAGAIPQPVVEVSLLMGAGSTAVVTTVTQGSTLGGTFTLRGGPRESPAIAWNASAPTLAASLAALGLPGYDLFQITTAPAQATTPSQGNVWSITFSFLPSPAVPALSCGSTAALTGSGAACVIRTTTLGTRETGGALAVSVSPPTTPGGLPLTSYALEWSLSPTFSPSVPRDDKGLVTWSDADALYGTQVISMSAGNGRGPGCVLGGTFAFTYGSSPPGSSYNATEVAARTTAQLPVGASVDTVRNALSSLYNLPTGVIVTAAPSTVALLDTRDATGGTPITVSTPPCPPPSQNCASWSTITLSTPVLTAGTPAS